MIIVSPIFIFGTVGVQFIFGFHGVLLEFDYEDLARYRVVTRVRVERGGTAGVLDRRAGDRRGKERGTLAYVWAKKHTRTRPVDAEDTSGARDRAKGARIYVYLRMYADYISGYNRSGRRNRCRCLFTSALRGYDEGTAGSTRAFLEVARASRNL